jgi:hypothetical protein
VATTATTTRGDEDTDNDGEIDPGNRERSRRWVPSVVLPCSPLDDA